MDIFTRKFYCASSRLLAFEKNKSITIIENVEYSLKKNWSLPPVARQKIYKSFESFTFKSDKIIKMVEETIPLKEESEVFYLLSKTLIAKNREKYNYLNLEMVQIALKPLTCLGLNA